MHAAAIMHRYYPDLAGRTVPRYTSYPTAAAFKPLPDAHAAALASVADDTPVSLYLHIPYCHEICWYCGCNTGALGRPARMDSYLAALEGEIARVGSILRAPVGSVHFGGGSPNAMSPTAFLALSATLRRHFAIAADAEWAVEIDPRHFTQETAQSYAAAGVSRLSIGAQTFSPQVQARIGRLQPWRQIAQTMADARRAGIARFNLDLMYGLPGQTLDDIAATLSAAFLLAPDRVAMFGYAHMPQLLPRQRRIDDTLLPDAEARFWQSALAHDLLIEAGFEAIGFDHFARPEDSLARAARDGTLRRNFQGFTDDRATTLIGLGASAISQFDGLFLQNEKHVGSYRVGAANGLLMGSRGLLRTPEDRMRGALIERLLCTGRVDVAEVAAEHGQSSRAVIGDMDRLAEFAERGLVLTRGTTVTISPVGRPYARLVASAFDTALQAREARFSTAV